MKLRNLLGGLCVVAMVLTPLTGCIPPQAPTASFTADATTGTVPLAVTFTDTSNGNGSTITAWSWNFGDGGTSTAQNPAHTYTSSGTFTVSLTVTTEAGSNTQTSTDLITVTEATNPPAAAFSATNTSGDIPLTVQFTDETTFDGKSTVTYAWSFGDGATSTEQSPSHTYTTVGTFSVSLTVTNSVGSDTETKTDLVTTTQAPTAPTAEFTGTPRSGQAPLTVQFTDTSDPGSSAIAGWSWDFNDGYTAGGTVDLQLDLAYLDTAELAALGIVESMPEGWSFNSIVTTDASESPQVKEPEADAEDNDLEIFWVKVPDLPLTLTYRLNVPAGESSDAIVTGMTLFRQNADQLVSNVETTTIAPRGSSTAQNPSHVFQTPGTYTVDLTATNAVGSDGRTRANYIQVDSPDLVAAEGEVNDLLMTLTRTLVDTTP